MEYSIKQKEYIKNANSRWNIKSGATRSGKSFVDISFIIPYRIRERINEKGIVAILGVSKATIERNVLLPMREIYGKELVGEINSQNICKIFGQEVYCLGAEKVNQVSKLRGSSIKYCYGDEVADWNKEVFELLKSRLDKECSCFDGSLNPQYPHHWLKEFLDSDVDLYLQEYTIFDNPFIPKEFVEQLCKEYQGTIYYDRYILGKWTRAEGAIYQYFSDNKEQFYITKEQAKQIKFNNLIIGLDFGGNKSRHAICLSGITKDNQLITLKSKCKEAAGITPMQLYRWVKEFIEECELDYDRVHYLYGDSAEQTLLNGLRSQIHIPVYNSIKRPINDRIRAKIQIMADNRYKIVEEECKDIIEFYEEAVWDEKSLEDVRLDNGTYNNDIGDAEEYSWEYYLNRLVRRNN